MNCDSIAFRFLKVSSKHCFKINAGRTKNISVNIERPVSHNQPNIAKQLAGELRVESTEQSLTVDDGGTRSPLTHV